MLVNLQSLSVLILGFREISMIKFRIEQKTLSLASEDIVFMTLDFLL